MRSFKKELNILVDSGFNDSYYEFISKFYVIKKVIKMEDAYNEGFSCLRDIDLMVFTGGADVNPALYNEQIGKYTNINKKRDRVERSAYINDYKNTPKLGICRGSQFLTVMNGGNLIQHVNGHLGKHSCTGILQNTQIEFEITSTHHQMMFPFNIEPKSAYELVAWSTYNLSDNYLNGNNEEIKLPSDFLEPEIVYYPDSNSLAIQGHPEFEEVSKDTVLTILQYIDLYLFNKNNL